MQRHSALTLFTSFVRCPPSLQASDVAPLSFEEAHPATGPQGGGFGDVDSNPLVEFNKTFRELNEQKDATERDAKAARKAAGKTALKGMLAERSKLVEARKAKNRDDEAAKESEMVKGLEGEPWARVSSLVDVLGSHAVTGEKKKGSSTSTEHVVGDVSRMKDVLIAVKNQPPATPTA